MADDDDSREPCGWRSDLPTFYCAPTATVVDRLNRFVRDAGPEQYAAWEKHVPALQRECRELAERDRAATSYSAILEYELPYDSRRPDLIILERAAVVVAELKGHFGLRRSAVDQVLAYARDLRAYHAQCADRPIVPVLITTGAARPPVSECGVRICHPSDFDAVLAAVAESHPGTPALARDFVAPGAYVPLPTIVQAARQLFAQREIQYVKMARACTTPALEHVTAIAHQAAKDGTRHLVLLSGVPGSGKTLVGLQLVHARWLDDLAEPRESGRPSTAGVYLSGNDPLVRVLQDALAGDGGGGQTFVRPIKKYVAFYARHSLATPPEHLIVYDEAQRAHDAERVAHVHDAPLGPSEPDLLLEFCLRVPRWSVFVALIGTGQAIHVGEEAGLPLWRHAVERVASQGEWTVHCAPAMAEIFSGGAASVRVAPELSLDTELRFHLTRDVQRFVESVLANEPQAESAAIAERLRANAHQFAVTRDLDAAKTYLRERFEQAPEMRYGMLASSKDKLLPRFGVDNSWRTTSQLRVGPWYNAPPADPRSCCRLGDVATEFASQGLELDGALLAWGSDFRRVGDRWTDDLSGGYQKRPRDRLALRRNVYRVLLTRGRNGTIVFVPPAGELDATFEHLVAVGFAPL